MNSPSVALTWEIWQRHRTRLLAMVSLLLAFALFYPKLCANLGLDLNSPNALDDLVANFAGRMDPGPAWQKLIRVLTLLFVLLGPLACMIMSLLILIWIFTLAQTDSRKGFAFPARFFTLPISTRFLVSWLMAAGLASVTVFFLGWTRLVRLPQTGVFDGYPDLLVWVTLLVVAQASVWALDAFPVARVLCLSAAVFGIGFLASPAIHNHPLVERHRTAILLSLLLTGGVAAYTGLGQIRRGDWQRWTLGWRTVSRIYERTVVGDGRAPAKAFCSPERAQFWFEWRRAGAKLFFFVCALSSVPVLILAAMVARFGPLNEDDTLSLSLYLLAVPLFIHFFHGVSPERTTPAFIATRPVSNGELVMAKLKAVALSTGLSWVVTLAMLSLLSLLGDMPAVIKHLPSIAGHRLLAWPLLPGVLLGLIILTWRFVAADLCFGLSGYSWVAKTPILKPYAIMAFVGLIFYLGRDAGFEKRLSVFFPTALALLVGLKAVLAIWAFRTSLERQLLTRSAMLKYVVIWTVLTSALLVPALSVFHGEKWVLSLGLGIILLLPLGRVGFAILALDIGRHQ